MDKIEYERVALMVEKEIEHLSERFNRDRQRWELETGEAMKKDDITSIQASIRSHNNQKQLAKEAWMVDDKNFPPIVNRMLQPLITRRKWSSLNKVDANSLLLKQSRIRDGAHFLFPERETGAYRNKHQKGFWSCKGCMPRRELPSTIAPVDAPFYQDQQFTDYWKQVQWCPNFVVLWANGRDPQQYMDSIRQINPDVAICYAGLLHIEFQINPEEARLIKFCDTCGFSSTEIKELAQPLPDAYEINADIALNERGGAVAMIHCKCNVCQELIFEAPADECARRNEAGGLALTAEYEQILNLHYAQEHPDAVVEEEQR